METHHIFGYFAAFCTTFSFLPQVIKTWREKETKDISLTMYVIFTLGVASWLVYGIMLREFPIIIANLLTFILSGIVLYLKLRYK